MLLGALIRGAVTSHPEFGSTVLGGPGDFGSWSHRPAVTVEEMTRWQRCDITDRRAVLLTAYTRVVVNAQGKLRPVWRRHGDRATTAQAGAGAADGHQHDPTGGLPEHGKPASPPADRSREENPTGYVQPHLRGARR